MYVCTLKTGSLLVHLSHKYAQGEGYSQVSSNLIQFCQLIDKLGEAFQVSVSCQWLLLGLPTFTSELLSVHGTMGYRQAFFFFICLNSFLLMKFSPA